MRQNNAEASFDAALSQDDPLALILSPNRARKQTPTARPFPSHPASAKIPGRIARFSPCEGCSDRFFVNVMMSRRPAGCVARRREDWLSCQAARRSLRAFWTSPYWFNFDTLGRCCPSACLRPIVSTDRQSAFTDGPVACRRTATVTFTKNRSEHPPHGHGALHAPVVRNTAVRSPKPVLWLPRRLDPSPFTRGSE